MLSGAVARVDLRRCAGLSAEPRPGHVGTCSRCLRWRTQLAWRARAFSEERDRLGSFPNNCPDQGCLKTISAKYPSELTWTMVLDGRDLGQVTGRTPKEFELYSHVGLQVVVSTVLSQPSAR